jgi:dolichyldiphosphatase
VENTYIGETSLLEFISVLASAGCYFAFALVVLLSIKSKSFRGFCLVLLLFAQYLVSEVLKRTIRIARPLGACSKSYGAPSAHCSFIMSVAAWLVLETYFLHEKSKFRSDRHYHKLRVFAWISLPLVAIGRIYLEYHTIGQVLGGCLVGISVAGLLFYVMHEYHIKHHHKSAFWRLWDKIDFHNNYSLGELLEDTLSAATGSNKDN